MLKKLLCLVLCLSFLLCAVACGSDGEQIPTDAPTNAPTDAPTDAPTNAPTDAPTDAPTQNPKPVSDFEYGISENGESVYIIAYVGSSDTVVIPSEIDGLPVTEIRGMGQTESGIFYVSKGAFEKTNVKYVTVPDTVTTLKTRSFFHCEELIEVTLSKNLKSYFFRVFQNCPKLQKIDLSQTKITEIAPLGFQGCASLTEVKLPNTLAVIGNNAFRDCSSLVEINLPESLESIGEGAFQSCTSLKTVTIPTKIDLTCIESSAFAENDALEKIIFQEGREEIKGYAFFALESDVEIIIPKSVKRFSSYPFFIYGNAKFVFLGDCPEIIEDKKDFYGNPTVCYDPATKGWDSCPWKDQYQVIPMQ